MLAFFVVVLDLFFISLSHSLSPLLSLSPHSLSPLSLPPLEDIGWFCYSYDVTPDPAFPPVAAAEKESVIFQCCCYGFLPSSSFLLLLLLLVFI